MSWRFEPPYQEVRVRVIPRTNLTGKMRQGLSVLRINGAWITKQTPSPTEYQAADRWYMGGHIYRLTDALAQELRTAGFTVTQVED